MLVPEILLEKDAGPIDGNRPGVGASMGLFRIGDSGRGNEGLFALNAGLGARAPGPTDCENFGMLLSGAVPFRSKFANEGVVGVGGNVSAVSEGEERLAARCVGRNMPAPGLEVVKYRTLYKRQC